MIEFYLIKQSAYQNGWKRLQLLEDVSLRRRFCRCMEGDKFLTIPYVLFCGRKLSAQSNKRLKIRIWTVCFGKWISKVCKNNVYSIHRSLRKLVNKIGIEIKLPCVLIRYTDVLQRHWKESDELNLIDLKVCFWHNWLLFFLTYFPKS